MSKSPVIRFVVAGVALILVLIPFHAFLTVWGSTLLGHYTLLRLWKELLLVPLSLAALWMVLRDQTLRRQFLGSWLFRLMIAYTLLFIVLGLISLKRHTVNVSALYEGLIVDLRPVVFFFLAWAAASYSPWVKDHWKQLLLIPAAIVVVFGLLQAFVLPADFLTHLGYNAATIQPFATVDQNMQFVRIQSSLRGSDPLGAYLVVILAAITAVVAGLVLRRNRARNEAYRKAMPWVLAGVATLVVLYFTYSRSAYIGALLAMAGAVWCSMPSSAVRRWLLVSGIVVCVVFGGAVFALRHNPTFEDTFFHTSQLSKSQHSSNQNHTTALESGVHDMVHDPFGRGPGSAGPASEHNIKPARISENYFLQIGQEAGVLGLGLFVAITFLVGKLLWDKRDEQLAMVMLVSLVGLTFVNLLLHAWADDTLAYIWWGLAGVAVGSIAMKSDKAKTGKVKA
jgi:hypothetical protein